MSGSAPPTVFLSASIPDPARWDGPFDPFAITDVVVATARAVFTRRGRLLTAAHPTIAPLILQVASGFPAQGPSRRVVLVQSRLFEPVLPDATRAMLTRPDVEAVWTDPAPGDRPEPGRWDASLAIMRQEMLRIPLAAAVFVGGMHGIGDEFARVAEVHPEAPRIAVATPGGAAADLHVENRFADESLADDLATSDLYPWLLDRVMDEILGPAEPPPSGGR